MSPSANVKREKKERVGERWKKAWERQKGTHALFVEYGDHSRRERVVCDLRDLQELVAVY
jgi:hypothetical protein